MRDGASFKSESGFDGYLLCADFDTFKSEGDRGIAGYLKVTDFLKQVSDCQAGQKIVILDAGHLPTEPRLGVIVNEFPDRLAEAVKLTGDPNLWVLSANSMHETSHVAHASHQSVFSHLVVRGLTGEADLDPVDDMVDLAELTSFVCGGVAIGWTGNTASSKVRHPRSCGAAATLLPQWSKRRCASSGRSSRSPAPKTPRTLKGFQRTTRRKRAIRRAAAATPSKQLPRTPPCAGGRP